MFGLFGKSKAIKQYIRQLPAQLKKDYGQIDDLNAEQIRRSIERGHFNEKYVMYAYMIFMTRKSFTDEFGGSDTYDAIADELGGVRPSNDSTYFVGNGYDSADSSGFDSGTSVGGSDSGGV
jgi:hypothetical protein